MTFKYTHYKVTSEQPLEKIEAYLKSIGAFPNTKWNEIMEQRGDALYVILYNNGKYKFYDHNGGYPEAFVPTTVNVMELQEQIKIVQELLEATKELNADYQQGWDENIQAGERLIKHLRSSQEIQLSNQSGR
jgi:hypothetical protein